ncbi:hypothetical protein IFM89_011416 [Coptis chinensis]|uniref:Amino acid transporter transmembrane domain-containing protein n=1 Tax=Coptis chinensis TaxID=261450 RepID=A0A835LRF3_9MAGN|nr:hypothetical protein IFM89_011416 [Coptis chinensis]
MVSYTITSATSMSFCLCMAKWISHGDIRGSLMGIMSREDATLSSASKTWSTFQALGNIAFAFTYAEVLIEIKLKYPALGAPELAMRAKELLLASGFKCVKEDKARGTAPFAKMAHPWPEHFYPLHVALGAAVENVKVELIHHSWSEGSLSYDSYRFKTV